MQAIFNELSTLLLPEMAEAQIETILKDFIKVCKQLKTLDSTIKLRVNAHFWETPLNGLGVIREYLSNNDELRNERELLYAIIVSPYLLNDEIDIDNDKFLEEDLVWLNDARKVPVDPDSGIRVAYAFYPKPAPVISFNTESWKKVGFINVVPLSKPNIKLINISNENQIFEIHFEKIINDYFEGLPETEREIA